MGSAELKSKAKEQLAGNWGIAIGAVLLAAVLTDFSITYDKISGIFGIEEVTLSNTINL